MCVSLTVSSNQVKQTNSANAQESNKQQEVKKMNKILLGVVPQDFKDSEKKAIERVLAHNPKLTFTDVTSPIDVLAYKETTLDNSGNIYVITNYSTNITGKLVIFKKENNKLINVWTSHESNIIGMWPISLRVKDIFHDGKKEITISGPVSNSANGTIIYRWEGTYARLIGDFITSYNCRSLAVKGSNKLPKDTTFNPDGDELVERGCSKARIYKWNGHDYKLYKVVKAVPGTPLYK